jgi:sulfoquinovose isomerase
MTTSYALRPDEPRWASLSTHRDWLYRQATGLLDLFERAVDPSGGFRSLDAEGEPAPEGDSVAELHATSRMIHCYVIGYLMGRPGSDRVIDHGMEALWKIHRDDVHGGYLWGIGKDGPTEDKKLAYGHAFVLLAASGAKLVGHPDADRLLADITAVLDQRFWDEAAGASREEFTRDWQVFDDYRGQNSNMHLTEALMAAFEATGDARFLARAERIADLILRRHAGAEGWRLPEHFDEHWHLDKEYSGSPMFRPYGTTPGHWLEWSRLSVQLWELGGRRLDWLPEAARNLFRQAVTEGWDEAKGGFYYTLEWDGAPRIKDRYWWPCCEGIGAASVLGAVEGGDVYEVWYRRIWNFTEAHFIDHEHGGWHPQLDDHLKPNSDPFFGKPDIYHALQACLIPLLPASGSITRGLVNARQGIIL